MTTAREKDKGIWGTLPQGQPLDLDMAIAIAVNQEMAVVDDVLRRLRERIVNLESAVALLKLRMKP